MKKSLALAATILLAGSASALSPDTPAGKLAGRTPGKPVSCISDFDRDRASALYPDGSIVFEGRSGRVYLNHPANCPFLGRDRLIVDRTPTSQLCKGDIFEVRDQTTPIVYGSCAYGEFTPYNRAAR
jgi:hypothetical protein